MRKIILFIFVIILALIAVALYRSSESFLKPLEKKELLKNQEAL